MSEWNHMQAATFAVSDTHDTCDTGHNSTTSIILSLRAWHWAPAGIQKPPLGENLLMMTIIGFDIQVVIWLTEYTSAHPISWCVERSQAFAFLCNFLPSLMSLWAPYFGSTSDVPLIMVWFALGTGHWLASLRRRVTLFLCYLPVTTYWTPGRLCYRNVSFNSGGSGTFNHFRPNCTTKAKQELSTLCVSPLIKFYIRAAVPVCHVPNVHVLLLD